MSSTKVSKKKRKQHHGSRIPEVSLEEEVSRHFLQWEAMQRKSSKAKSLRQLAKTRDVHPLLWGIEATTDAFDPGFAYWTASTTGDFRFSPVADDGDGGGSTAEAVSNWLRAFGEQIGTTLNALECLAAAHTIARRRAPVDAATWERCLTRLATVAHEAQSMHALHDAWEAQLFAAELPITLAYLFHPCKTITPLGPMGVSFLEESLDRLVDEDGLLSEAPVERFMPLLASWTRCILMIGASRKMKLSKSARRKYSAFVRYVLRLLNEQCAVPFEPRLSKVSIRSRRGMFRAIAPLLLSKRQRQLVNQAASNRGIQSAPRRTELVVGDDGSTALLQSNWQSSNGRLFVDFSRAVPRIHLDRQSDTILTGLWQPTVAIGGAMVETRSTWNLLFSHSDKDIDLVEIESELGGQWRLQRQFVLAKQDGFVYMADLVHGPTDERIEYSLTLPIAPACSFHGADETRECTLRSARYLARFLPLAAPEWRSESSSCQLETDPPKLVVRRDSPSRRLYAPLFIDLNRRRRGHELTWRRLAVAENLQRVNDEIAVGYRVQIGAEQWLFYRSFTRVGNRTLLGQNLSSEFFCGRFLTDGSTETLIEVEVDPLRNSEHANDVSGS